MALPPISRAKLGMGVTAFQHPGVDVAILAPVRQPGAAIDVGTSAIVEPPDNPARPGRLVGADPGSFDGGDSARAKAMALSGQAAQHLHEVVEIAAVPLRAAQRPPR